MVSVDVKHHVYLLTNLAAKHARKHEAPPPQFRLDSIACGFICAGVNFAGGYKWHALFYLSCL